MRTKGLAEFLGRQSKIGVDTSIFIYQIEANPKYEEAANVVFEWIASQVGLAVTSTVTMLELLVAPYRIDDLERVAGIYGLLSTFPHLEWVSPTLPLADLAARIRAAHGLKTPDALQAATAIMKGASGYVTNDPAFRRVAELEVAILDDML